MEDDVIQIAKFYGIEKQSYQAIEEMSELTKELVKYMNRGADNKKEILEEIADVQVMILQLIYLYDDDANIEKIMLDKLLRQKNRIKNKKRC